MKFRLEMKDTGKVKVYNMLAVELLGNGALAGYTSIWLNLLARMNNCPQRFLGTLGMGNK
jgi:hypothetical protein